MLSCIGGRNVGFRSRPLIMRFKIVAVIRGKSFPFFALVNAASFFDFRLFSLFSPSFPFARCNPVAFSVNIDNDDHTVTYTLTSLVFSPLCLSVLHRYCYGRMSRPVLTIGAAQHSWRSYLGCCGGSIVRCATRRCFGFHVV